MSPGREESAQQGGPGPTQPVAQADTSDDPRVSHALREYLALLEAGLKPDRGEFLGRNPDIAPRLAEAIEGLEFIHAVGPALPSPGADPGLLPGPDKESSAAQPLGDFRLVREIGRGGMGVVYEAEQLSLGRPVALKMLPLAAALDPRQLQRFKNEAQAAAGLHHSNIVPVYFVGCERGVHFYAMQLIDGQSLAAMVRELRCQAGLENGPGGGPDSLASALAAELKSTPLREASAEGPAGVVGAETRPSPASTLSPGKSGGDAAYHRNVARLGVQAAEALHYAHQMGVVHRDVKPGNLLLDLHGRLWVTDFGLARVRLGGELTGTQDVVGTLRYMSPEQAQGGAEAVDHRTDVYSLGVSLYELLTLDHPFARADRQELLRLIGTKEPRPPRSLNAAIPADLETVVLKAMAKSPGDRYASAGDLAEDLRRFLDHRPVLARRPTQLQKLRKWVRRHRAGVTTAAATLTLGLVAGLAASTLLVWREKRRVQAAYEAESRARDEAVAQRRRAEERQRLARRAVEAYMAVSERWLAADGRLTPGQRAYLNKALAFYEELARGPGPGREERYEAAKAYFRLGQVRMWLGQYAEALAAHQKNRDLIVGLVKESPQDPAYRLDLYRAHMNVGAALSEAWRTAEEEEAQREAWAVIRALAADHPSDPRYRDAVANQGASLGPLLRHRGRYLEAERVHAEALAAADKLVGEFPREPRYPRNQALNLLHLGKLFRTTGRVGEAEGAYRRALQIGRKLAGACPEEPAYRQEVVDYSLALGDLFSAGGKLAEAGGVLTGALEVEEALAAAYPEKCEYREGAARVLFALCQVYHASKQPKQAEGAFRRCLALVEGLAKGLPKNARYQAAVSSYLLDCPVERLRDPKRAVEWAKKAVALQPGRPDWWTCLGVAHYRSGECKEAAAALEKGCRTEPHRTVRARFYLAAAYWGLGEREKARQEYLGATAAMKQYLPHDDEARRARDEVWQLMRR